MLDEKDWFNWSLKNWGVKSDAIQSDLERIGGTIMRVYFVIPMESPLRWLVETYKKFSNLKFKLETTYTYDVIHEARIEQFIIKEGSVLNESTKHMVF
jgi:hypothetical protein